jgi:transcriptional regulator with XRE-family HTH domain
VSYQSISAQPERLRAAILAAVGNEVGWSVRAGEHLGVTHKTVSRWLCGDRAPSLVHFVAIADMTGRSLDWLVRGKQ